MLPRGTVTTVVRPVARFSTRARHTVAQGGAQAITFWPVAITLRKVRPARGSGGFHSRSVVVARPMAAGSQQQAAAGRPVDDVTGRQPELRADPGPRTG